MRQLNLHQDIQSHLRLELLTSVPLNGDDRDFAMIDKLPYLNAIIMESLRLVDTVSSYQTRVVPKGGCLVSGNFLPAGVSTCIGQGTQSFVNTIAIFALRVKLLKSATHD